MVFRFERESKHGMRREGRITTVSSWLTLMLKEMVFLCAAIVGLGVSSGSDSSLCLKDKKHELISLKKYKKKKNNYID